MGFTLVMSAIESDIGSGFWHIFVGNILVLKRARALQYYAAVFI